MEAPALPMEGRLPIQPRISTVNKPPDPEQIRGVIVHRQRCMLSSHGPLPRLVLYA